MDVKDVAKPARTEPSLQVAAGGKTWKRLSLLGIFSWLFSVLSWKGPPFSVSGDHRVRVTGPWYWHWSQHWSVTAAAPTQRWAPQMTDPAPPPAP